MTKVKFRLDDPDQPRSESLNATELGKRRYRLDNVPFYARDVSLGDIVSASEQDGELWYRETLEKSGHGTMRIFSNAGFDSGIGRQILDALRSRNFQLEFLGGKIAAACIPVEFEDLDWLEGFLQPLVSDDVFYEISDW